MAFSDAERVAAKSRTELSERQKQVSASLAYGYKLAHDRLLADLEAFYREVEALDEIPTRTWLNENTTLRRAFDRYNSALIAMGVETNRVAYNAATEAAAKGATTGAEMLAALGAVTGPARFRAPTDFLDDRLTAGLDDLIKTRAGAQAETVKGILIESVRRGDDPYRTARKMRKTADGFQGALTIVRTEQMNAYRESNMYTFREAGDVETWMWSSRKSTRTCPSCWALDGQTFPVTQSLNSHPNCMCVAVPVLGDEDTARQVTGPQAFEKLPKKTKRQILGPSASLAYENGELALPDLIGVRKARGYPDSYGTKSLKNVLGTDRVNEIRRELRG